MRIICEIHIYRSEPVFLTVKVTDAPARSCVTPHCYLVCVCVCVCVCVLSCRKAQEDSPCGKNCCGTCRSMTRNTLAFSTQTALITRSVGLQEHVHVNTHLTFHASKSATFTIVVYASVGILDLVPSCAAFAKLIN